jgi:molybdopterin converting factor small subunit
MKVIALFHGVLSDWVGTEKAELELNVGAFFADLLSAIGKGYRHKMPDLLWDDQQNTFAKPVQAFSEDKPINSLEVPLADGQEVKFFLMAAGG